VSRASRRQPSFSTPSDSQTLICSPPDVRAKTRNVRPQLTAHLHTVPELIGLERVPHLGLRALWMRLRMALLPFARSITRHLTSLRVGQRWVDDALTPIICLSPFRSLVVCLLFATMPPMRSGLSCQPRPATWHELSELTVSGDPGTLSSPGKGALEWQPRTTRKGGDGCVLGQLAAQST
jgi:hypothetical protein